MLDHTIVASSYCTECDLLVHWRIGPRSDPNDPEALDSITGTNFVCDHWRNHHEAVAQLAADEGPGEWEWNSGMVIARRLTDNPALRNTDPL